MESSLLKIPDGEDSLTESPGEVQIWLMFAMTQGYHHDTPVIITTLVYVTQLHQFEKRVE